MNNICKKTVKINANEVDCNRNYTLCALLRSFHEVVDDHAIEMGIDGDTVLKKYGAIWILTHIRVDIKEQVKWHDELEVATYPLKPGIVRIEREGTFVRGGEPVACLSSEWCLLDKASGRPRRPEQTGCPMDMEYMTGMVTAGYTKYDPTYSSGDRVFSHTVRVSDLDINAHMNNVAYARLAVDAFSMEELTKNRVTSFEITFRAQCYEGEVIDVYRTGSGESAFVSAIKSDGTRVFDTMFTFAPNK